MTLTPYRTDLAYIHDVGFGDFARKASAGLLAELRRCDLTSGRVVDLGCGSGIWASTLTDAGYEALGIDLSPAMIERARRQAPDAAFVVCSFLDIDLPPCVAVTSIGECLNYLFDPQNSREQLGRLFERIFAALQPGGLFMFDVAQPGYARATGPPRRHTIGDDWAVLVQVEEDEKARTLTRSITSFRKMGETYRRDDESHRIQLLRGADLARDLRRIGFRVRISRAYGEYRISPGCRALLARKPR